ncbi:helix-turn-helix domain-containing protein [Saccharibacter floricola]|nr:hypothetical protein [Saccharibacter floricola]
MTPHELETILTEIGLSNSALARHVNRSEGNVRQWRKGVSKIPDDVAEWLREYHYFFQKNPPPQRKG